MKAPQRLQEMRERRLLSQNELSKRTGVAQETIARLERGESSAWPRTLRKLADGLGVNYEELYEEPTAPLAEPPRERPSGPAAGGSSFGESHILAERRLLSSLHPFATQVEGRTEYWRGLAESGKVSLDTLEYATEELGFTAQGFKDLVDAAIAEHWSAAELGLLTRVYESINGPYREAWNALMEAWAKGSADMPEGSRRLRLVADADKAMREVEEAEEAVRTAA